MDTLFERSAEVLFRNGVTGADLLANGYPLGICEAVDVAKWRVWAVCGMQDREAWAEAAKLVSTSRVHLLGAVCVCTKLYAKQSLMCRKVEQAFKIIGGTLEYDLYNLTKPSEIDWRNSGIAPITPDRISNKQEAQEYVWQALMAGKNVVRLLRTLANNKAVHLSTRLTKQTIKLDGILDEAIRFQPDAPQRRKRARSFTSKFTD